ncbi:hypothetical protein JL720_11587 [Aureococcus anophagefferens]|nr:hypothetical protein JL720_11587 [Aureococcus anophagefferens]
MVGSRRGVHRFEGLTQRRGASTCYLQQLPEHVFAQNICRNLNAWGFASCGTCCTWLKEAVLDDDDAWARRLRASDTLLQRYSPSAIAVEFVDCRVRSSQLWAQVYDDGGALCAGDTQREASSRVEASRFARVVALTASLHDVEAAGAEGDLGVWGLGGLQLYRLRDSVHSARETSSLLARGVLYHIGDAARRAAVDASLDASQRAVAFLCFVKANVGRPRPSGIKRPVLIVSDPE